MQSLVQVGQHEVQGSRPQCFMATSSASLEAHPQLVPRGKLGSGLPSCRVGSGIAPASPLPVAGPCSAGSKPLWCGWSRWLLWRTAHRWACSWSSFHRATWSLRSPSTAEVACTKSWLCIVSTVALKHPAMQWDNNCSKWHWDQLTCQDGEFGSLR